MPRSASGGKQRILTQDPRRKHNEPAPSAAWWDTHVAPIIEHFALPIALCFILIGAARIVSTYRSLSITTDEPYHFTCGLDYFVTGRVCAPENPPLEPLASALLPYLAGVRPDPGINIRWQEAERRGAIQHHEVRENIGIEQMWSILRRRPDPWRMIMGMRVGVLPFFVAAALAVFFGAKHFFGKAVAVLSTALFTLTPPVLAHAGVATTDISLTATLAAAFFALACWSEAPSYKRASWLGLAAGLTAFSKFSGISYLAAAAAVAIVFHIAVVRPSRADLLRLARERIPGLLLAGAVAGFVLWAGCLFSVGRVEGWPAWIKVPAPELFDAFRELMAHVRRGQPAYLLGQYRLTGWWYYYPVALSVKTPIALILAVAVGLFACWERRGRQGLLPVALCLGILLVAMMSPINIGVRHVLPVFVGLSVIGGLGLLRLVRTSVLLPAILGVWMAISGALAHPNYLSYFNEAVGGHPENFIYDSDIEWDQSWVGVGRALRAHGAPEVTLDLVPRSFTSEEVLERLYGLPPVRFASPKGMPVPGWHVVHVPILRVWIAQIPVRPADMSVPGQLAALMGPSYARLTPVERVGGLLLCYFNPTGKAGLSIVP